MKKMLVPFLISLLAIFSFCLQLTAQPGTWTWMKGDSAFLYPGHYGTKGVPNPANAPPAMYSPTRWKDLDGNFWFYGGFGPQEFLGDLWKFNPAQNVWTWIKGDGQVNQPVVYGTQGIPSPANNPGCRGWACASWVEVFNMLGQLIFSSIEKNSPVLWKEKIDLSNFESGVYMIKVSAWTSAEKSTDVFVRKKIIISK